MYAKNFQRPSSVKFQNYIYILHMSPLSYFILFYFSGLSKKNFLRSPARPWALASLREALLDSYIIIGS